MLRTTTLLLACLLALTPPLQARQAPAGDDLAGTEPDSAAVAEPDSVAAGACRAALAPAAEPGDPGDGFARMAEISGAAPLQLRSFVRPSRSATARICVEAAAPWAHRLGPLPETEGWAVEPLPVNLLGHVNTAYPRGPNSGALWAGRGLSTELRGGVRGRLAVRSAVLSAAIAPRIIHQRNREFEFPEHAFPQRSPYAHHIHPWNIDWPHRFGPDPFWTLDPGQSFVRADWRGLGAGVSTENLWWGPALHYPLILSNNAPGFPHVFLETAEPADVRIGRLEAQLVWGRLSESDWFDFRADNDRRLLAGIVLAFEPVFLPGFSIGLTRVYSETIPPDGMGFRDIFIEPYRSLRENPQVDGAFGANNQLAALFLRWVHPASGFELFGQYGREDHWDRGDEPILVPEASRAYGLGFQWVAPRADGWWRFYGELINLQDPLPISHFVRQNVIRWYTHSRVQQGHTHRGQILGAWVGPGADAQILGADRLASTGQIGAWAERVRHDVDMYYVLWAPFYGIAGKHDVELTAGVRYLRFLGDFQVGSSVAYSHRRNRHFIGLNRANPQREDGIREVNWSIRLEVGWRPPAELIVRSP